MLTIMGENSKEEMLEELGLTKNDSKVYLTLLREGTSTITTIAKKSGLYRPNVYGAIDRLKSRGLVSEYIENTSRKFKAADPSALAAVLQEKELKLKSILPQFHLDYQLSDKNNLVEVYEGVAAIRSLFQHYVELGESIYDFGVPQIAVSLLGEYYQNVIHQKRVQKKQWMYHIYNSDAKERIKFLNKLPYTEAKYLHPEFNFPVATRICGKEISITHYAKNPMTIVIRSAEMAEAYRKYFAILWEKAQN